MNRRSLLPKAATPTPLREIVAVGCVMDGRAVVMSMTLARPHPTERVINPRRRRG